MNASPNLTNRRVLAVDDNPAIHEDFRKILSCPAASDPHFENLEAVILEANAATDAATDAGQGFELDSAFQGDEGLAKVTLALQQGRPYAIAFVDMRMPPGWDGFETMARLWQADPALQIIICTAYSDYQWHDILRELGNRGSLAVLKKPFDNIEVIQLCEVLAVKWTLTRVLPAAGQLLPAK